MKLYIAGPMRGIKDFNFPTFKEAAAQLRFLGHTVFNPAERDEATHGAEIGKSTTGNLAEAKAKGFDHRKAMADDARWIALEADGVVLLPGWEKSRGACAEKALAEALGLDVFAFEPMWLRKIA